MTDFKQIEREAAAERQHLATSLEVLSAAISPENIKDHAAALAENYGGDLGRQAWDAARQNPAAFALVGAGLSLLLTGTGSRPDARRSAAVAVPPTDALVGFDERVAAADADMKEDMTGMMERDTPPRAAWLRAKLNDGLETLPESARLRVLNSRQSAVDAQEKVEAQARHVAQKSKTFMHEQPLAVGAIAIGFGALIGALLPSTRREDDMLGERRDAVMAAARSTLSEEMDKAHHAARASINGNTTITN